MSTSKRAKAKNVDPKAKRQKVTVAVGTAVLAVVLAIQVPKMLRLTSPGGDTAIAAPTQSADGSAAGATAPGEAGAGADTTIHAVPADPAADAAATAADTVDAGDLESFGRFRSKDPFAPQLAATSGGAGRSESLSAAAPSGSSQRDATATDGAAPSPTGATVSVNGVPEQVAVGDSFPRQEAAFKLIALTAGAAKVGLVTGSYVDGGHAITLPRGKTLTLMNTATGARYRLRLVSVSAA